MTAGDMSQKPTGPVEKGQSRRIRVINTPAFRQLAANEAGVFQQAPTISGTQPLSRTANRTLEVGLPNDFNDVDVHEGETVADSVSAAPPTSWGRSPPPVVERY